MRPCGFGASTNADELHLEPSSDPGFQLTSQIQTNKCGCSGRRMDPHPHPQRMKVVKHLLYAWSGCVNHSICQARAVVTE